jgi:hypothetical protein
MLLLGNLTTQPLPAFSQCALSQWSSPLPLLSPYSCRKLLPFLRLVPLPLRAQYTRRRRVRTPPRHPRTTVQPHLIPRRLRTYLAAAVARATQLLRRIRLGMVLRTPRPLRRIRRPMAQRILPGMVPRTPPLRRLIRLMALRIPQVPTRPAAATAHAPRVVLPIRLSRSTRRLRPQGRTHPQQ